MAEKSYQGKAYKAMTKEEKAAYMKDYRERQKRLEETFSSPTGTQSVTPTPSAPKPTPAPAPSSTPSAKVASDAAPLTEDSLFELQRGLSGSITWSKIARIAQTRRLPITRVVAAFKDAGLKVITL